MSSKHALTLYLPSSDLRHIIGKRCPWVSSYYDPAKWIFYSLRTSSLNAERCQNRLNSAILRACVFDFLIVFRPKADPCDFSDCVEKRIFFYAIHHRWKPDSNEFDSVSAVPALLPTLSDANQNGTASTVGVFRSSNAAISSWKLWLARIQRLAENRRQQPCVAKVSA